MTDHKHKKHGEEPAEKPDQPTPPGDQPSEPATPSGNGGQGAGQEAQAPMVALSMEEFDALQAEAEKAKTDAKNYLDGWQRERAEFANFKRRVEREQSTQTGSITGQVIKKYLVILDDLERALKTRPTADEGAAWSDGIELIYRKLQNILEGEGVRRIEAEGSMFDPTQHEALMQEDSPNHQSGQVIEVVQQGYKIGERVLRPALVRVAR